MNIAAAGTYTLLAIAGILCTAAVWSRITGKNGHHDYRLTLLYFWGLIGALIGAKLAFLFAEGWAYRDDWMALLTGRSITGGLLGGYIAVEIGKKYLGYPRTTGDAFALVVPLGLMIGRIGCIAQGCCPGEECGAHWWAVIDAEGVHRWPSAHIELLFNAAFFIWTLLAARFNWQNGNWFHLYLIAYGVFRLLHESVRANQTLFGEITGYQIIAAAMVMLGAWRYLQRRRENAQPAAA